MAPEAGGALADKPRHRARIRREFRPQHLDRANIPDDAVTAAPDNPHPALANRLFKEIPTPERLITHDSGA
jgi:hypothetical protein